MLVRRFILVSAAALVVGLFALAGVVRAEDSLWQTDFAAAKAKAKAEKKLMLVDFTGSDWCGWCMKLVSEVFSKDAFKTEAPKKFVLVELDYPRTKKVLDKQSAKLKKQNQELLTKYKVQGFPTILVMDPAGEVVARTGYQAGGPEKHVKHLTKFVDAHEDIVKLTKELPKAKGLDRAKLLDKLIDDYVALNNEIDEIPAWDKEIVKLDADDKAGLKAKHQFRIYMAEFSALAESGKLAEAKAVADKMLALPRLSAQQQLDVYLGLSQAYQASRQFAEASAAVDKALAVPGISTEQKQDAYFAKCICTYGQGDFVGVVACAKKGMEIDPKSEQAKRLTDVIDQVKPMAEAQESIGKLKAEQANLKGIDRAKTLDKLIEAWEKVGRRSRDVSAQQIDKWSREIVTLDADGKAKLKIKYQFRNMMADAANLEGRPAEYRAAVEKALALPALSGEQTQSGHFDLAVSYLRGQDVKNALDQLQKAYDAAPGTQRGQMIKANIERIKQQMGAMKPEK
jgi:thioredoxin-related protein